MILEIELTVARIVRLRDGRSVGLAEFGAGAGFPVVNAHGGFACRLDVAAAVPASSHHSKRHIENRDGGHFMAHPHYRSILASLRG